MSFVSAAFAVQIPVIALLVVLRLLGAEPQQAIAYGGGSCGKIEGAVALACSGPNYAAYSTWGCLLGRTFVHPLVHSTVTDAYGELAASHARHWQFGETGHRNGGSFWPHRTHQNGLAVDFMTPMKSAEGDPKPLPISPLNGFGYGIEIDGLGRLGELEVDWQALGDHLLALHRVGRAQGVHLSRIILAPKFREELLRRVPEVRGLAGVFSRRQAWVRHDEHYHVDFEIPRRYRKSLRCR